jgi:DNA-binding CsgD family transcriptional regulator
MDYYWQRVLEEVKHRYNPAVTKYFVHFPEMGNGTVSNRSRILRNNETTQKRYYLGAEFPGIYLTAREYQCAQLFLQGLSQAETALQLGLSHRTIESYFMHIRSKLRCKSRAQILCILRTRTDLSQ